MQYFVDRYGDSILIEPPRRGIGLAVWTAPVAILLMGGLVLASLLRGWLRPRWSATSTTVIPDVVHRNGSATADVPAVASSLDRVDAEFERFRQES